MKWIQNIACLIGDLQINSTYTQAYFGHRSVEGGLLNGCPMGDLLYRFFKIKNYLFIQKLN